MNGDTLKSGGGTHMALLRGTADSSWVLHWHEGAQARLWLTTPMDSVGLGVSVGSDSANVFSGAGQGELFFVVASSTPAAESARSQPAIGSSVPAVFALWPSAPNPIAETATIRYDLPVPARVRLTIYDMQGRRVRSLVEGEQKAGAHAVAWDLHDAGGQRAGPGVYVCDLEAGSFAARRKLVVLP
jgi:hypothetical protein